MRTSKQSDTTTINECSKKGEKNLKPSSKTHHRLYIYMFIYFIFYFQKRKEKDEKNAYTKSKQRETIGKHEQKLKETKKTKYRPNDYACTVRFDVVSNLTGDMNRFHSLQFNANQINKFNNFMNIILHADRSFETLYGDQSSLFLYKNWVKF